MSDEELKQSTGEKPEDFEAPASDIEHKEKEPVSRIIVIDDNYADNLANIFIDEKEKSKRPQVDKAQDLESALKLIESVKDPRGVGVITDLFFPEKKSSKDQSEGLKVIGEILNHFGVDHDTIEEMIGNYKALIKKHGSYIYDPFSGQIEYKLFNKVQEAFGVGDDQPENPKLKDFFNEKNFYVDGDMIHRLDLNDFFKHFPGVILEGEYNVSQDSINALKAEEIHKGNIIEKEEWASYMITEKGFQEYNAKHLLPKRYAGNSKAFLGSICYSLTHPDNGGIMMGVRVAEAAHQKKLPVVIVTGAHGTTPVNIFVAQYLFDRGIIDSPGIGSPYEFISMEQVKVDGPMGVNNVYTLDTKAAEEDLKQYSFFVADKEYRKSSGDESRNAVTENILKIIGKTLETKIQQQKY